jgi:ATP-dependent protease ClpP protease subunit
MENLMAAKKKVYRKAKPVKKKKKKTVEIININGYIDENEYLSFCKKMTSLEEKKSIKKVRVIINTDGGSFYDGFAIASRIMSSHLYVSCEIYGRAFSAGSVIAMAGAETHMGRYAKLMVHEISTMVVGTTTEIYKQTLQLLKEQEEWCKYMEAKTSVCSEQWDKWMRDETFFTAEQALEYGIIDDILDEQ